MNTNLTLKNDLEAVKELYGQLFMLLDQSVQEDPVTRASADLDKAIRQLRSRIDAKASPFREAVAQARRNGTIEPAFDEAIKHFDGTLTQGLTVMQERLEERMRALGLRRDDMRTKLKKVHHKKSGMKAYAIPRSGGNFIESDI